MFVSEVWMNIEPLRNYTLEFKPGVNLLRGKNGVGKTATLEAIALAGHLTLMRSETFESDPSLQGNTECRAIVRYVLTENDRNFLLRNFGPNAEPTSNGLVSYGKGLCRDCPETSGRFWNDEALSRVRCWVSATLISQENGSEKTQCPPPIVIGLMCKINDSAALCSELKHSLADEARLRANWFCGVIDQSAHMVIGLLLSISRPERLNGQSKTSNRIIQGAAPEGGERVLPMPQGLAPSCWSRTYRAQVLDVTDETFPNGVDAWFEHSARGSASLPGFVAYLNTDMYQFGIGLDIRESPKEMGKEMTEVLLDRLQLLRLQRPTPASEHHTYKIRRFTAISDAWSQIFEPKSMRGPALPDDGGGDLNSCSLTRSVVTGDEAWAVEVGKKNRGFFSSGENQTFYMLALTQCNAAYGSCLLIDEPELHLSLGGASSVFNYMFSFSKEYNSQIIVVTHVPFLFTRRFREGDVHLQVIDQGTDRRQSLEGIPALNALYNGQGRNVQELFDDIRVPDHELGVLRTLFGRHQVASFGDRRRKATWLRKAIAKLARIANRQRQ